MARIRHKKAHIISLMMCKGGVGKTTTAFLIAKKLSSLNKKILAIDTDPQGNFTASTNLKSYNIDIDENTPVLSDLLSRECSIEESIIKLTPHFHLIPSTGMNSLNDRRLEMLPDPVTQLANALSIIQNYYDYIIFDSAPALNLVNASIAYTSDLVILPVTLDEYSKQGLEQTLFELENLQRKFRFKTNIRILVNMFRDDKLSLLYMGLLAEANRNLILSSTIRFSTQIRRSLSNHDNIFLRHGSSAKEDYDKLSKEIISSCYIHQRSNYANL